MKSCGNCFFCMTRCDLVEKVPHVYKHRDPAIEALLNSELQPREVWCDKGYWEREDGDQFVYANFDRLGKNPSRFHTAENCEDYLV